MLRPLLCAVVSVCAAHAQTPTWKAEYLGTAQPGWSLVAATAVNDAGTTTGITYVAGYKLAWIAAPGLAPELLPLPAGAIYSDVFDVNAAGVACGQVLYSGNVSRAVVWRPEPTGYEVTVLPDLGGIHPFDARGINDAGEVVGKLGILNGSYSWTKAGGVVQIPTSLFPVVPEDINDRRQIVGDTYRMDLDDLVLEDLGNPTGTGYDYLFTVLTRIDDIGECAGYANVATGGSWSKQAVRYTDGVGWKAFNGQPLLSANVMDLAASGDTAYQLGSFGSFVWVEGFGNIALEDTVDDPAWNLSGSFAPVMSTGGRIACNGVNTATGEAGIVLLTPLSLGNRGGGLAGELGVPVLSGFGTLEPGAPTRVRLASAAPDAVAFLAFALDSAGPLHAAPARRFVQIDTDAWGRFDVTFAWPGSIAGEDRFLQGIVLDPAAPGGKARSNVLRGVTH